MASIKHKNNNKQTSRKQKEETPPAPVVEEDTKEEKAKLVSDIIFNFISSEIVRTLLHIFICPGTYFRTAAAGTDHSEPGQHHGPTEESQDQPGLKHNDAFCFNLLTFASKVMDITGKSEDEVATALFDCGWDAARAIDMLLEEGRFS